MGKKQIIMNKTLIWLDDERNPDEPQWQAWQVRWSPIGHIGVDVVWLKSFKEFKLYLLSNPWPDAICFDHDLGLEESGYDCAKYLVNLCIEKDIDIPAFAIHSMNPVGKNNIEAVLINYHEHYLRTHN